MASPMSYGSPKTTISSHNQTPSTSPQTRFTSTPIQPQPHLVTLVLQSKKALQHGEQLCIKAHTSSNDSAACAIDVLALDAKVKWLGHAVSEQLALAVIVAKSLEEKRTALMKEINEWDGIRMERTNALDDILDSLGSQVVPPDFHESTTDSSLFGSQNSAGEIDHPTDDFMIERTAPDPSNATKCPPRTPVKAGRKSSTSMSPTSPSETLRRNKVSEQLPSNVKSKPHRKNWKTLRDFVDDKGIEEMHEMIDKDRQGLEDILSATDDYPEILSKTIQRIHLSLPASAGVSKPVSKNDYTRFNRPDPNSPGGPALPKVQELVIAQERMVNAMAGLLENLTGHYDNMATALHESESGEVFDEEDLMAMNRDTNELPAIMTELDNNFAAVQRYQSQLNMMKEDLQLDVQQLDNTLNDLEKLGDIMTEMIQTQEKVEAEAEAELTELHHHLTTLTQLHERFVAYRMAFNKLVLEISRRRNYREGAEVIVQGMMRQLNAMSQEESELRNRFNAEYGPYLPEDLCLFVKNEPTTWLVVPSDDTPLEDFPEIDRDLINEAKDRVGYAEAVAADSV
ncbi:hypothetical protein CVT24_008765 [Panaeolus cyanescens]|uniref:Autophagy-related protein 17 n=1 Tax=Panaeolus cyanescens TaxID=181874 RepID=A0A409VDN4_9AGAR|nr:hypothetical protein CVT24_008765 [Panaeolus cyanescens]